MNRIIPVFLSLLILSIALVAAPPEGQDEAFAVPALNVMHKIIHPLWHDAYPAKDIAKIRSFFPLIEEQYGVLKKVKFPQERPDRQMHWNKGISRMDSAITMYRMALEKNDEPALLTAVRALHDSFEHLVHVANPPVPEMDNFHQVMFRVFHDYLPAKQWENIRQAIPLFRERMDALNRAQLPKQLADKQAAFDAARQELDRAVSALAALQNSRDNGTLLQVLSRLHDAYKQLEKVMD